MSPPPDWMPVFVVVAARRSYVAADPKSPQAGAQGTTAHGQDVLQRIGTAVRRPDGGYSIELTALPVNGRLLMRPPQPGELLDPTQGGGA